MRIAHISDLHFSKLSFSPNQLFSKRLLGNLNCLFSRKKAFDTDRLFSLIHLFKQEKVDRVIITGDLSTTSLKAEFERASEFIRALEGAGIPTHVLPGNHDQYTKKVYTQKTFYDYFPSPLKEKGVCKTALSPGWWLISLDTALATSLFSSRGHFTPILESELTEVLNTLPSSDKIILANHFSLFNNDGARKALLRAEELRNLVSKYPNILFYLHGHTHRHCVADLRCNGFPIILDSGSASHKETGTWNLMDISPKECLIKVFQHQEEGTWYAYKQFSFIW